MAKGNGEGREKSEGNDLLDAMDDSVGTLLYVIQETVFDYNSPIVQRLLKDVRKQCRDILNLE